MQTNRNNILPFAFNQCEKNRVGRNGVLQKVGYWILTSISSVVTRQSFFSTSLSAKFRGNNPQAPQHFCDLGLCTTVNEIKTILKIRFKNNSVKRVNYTTTKRTETDWSQRCSRRTAAARAEYLRQFNFKFIRGFGRKERRERERAECARQEVCKCDKLSGSKCLLIKLARNITVLIKKLWAQHLYYIYTYKKLIFFI